MQEEGHQTQERAFRVPTACRQRPQTWPLARDRRSDHYRSAEDRDKGTRSVLKLTLFLGTRQLDSIGKAALALVTHDRHYRTAEGTSWAPRPRLKLVPSPDTRPEAEIHTGAVNIG